MAQSQKSQKADRRVRLDPLLSRRAGVIAEHHGMSLAEWLNEILWPIVRKELPRVVKELEAEELAVK